MRTVNLDAIRERVGKEPCADCGQLSETFMVNAEATVYVCFGCWRERHQRRAKELKRDRKRGVTAARRFADRLAAAKREHGEDEWADAHDQSVASR